MYTLLSIDPMSLARGIQSVKFFFIELEALFFAEVSGFEPDWRMICTASSKFTNTLIVLQLDYISRLMWQAQLQGHKTWRLNPPPECEDVCQSFQFRVEPGDICEYSHPSPL